MGTRFEVVGRFIDDKEALMSIALNALRSLNNEDFQNKHMSWKPQWTIYGAPKTKLRDEIEHWQDHIRALQKWWTPDNLDDESWSEIVSELKSFMQPENWHICNLQRDFMCSMTGDELDICTKDEYLYRLFEEPIHVAAMFGLTILVDIAFRESRNTEAPIDPSSHRGQRLKHLKTERAKAIIDKFSANKFFMVDLDIFLPGLEEEELNQLLKIRADEEEKNGKYRLRKFQSALEDMSPEAWTTPKPLSERVSPGGECTLVLAAPYPETFERLVQYGASKNKRCVSNGAGKLTYEPPLHTILRTAVHLSKKNTEDEKVPKYARSAEILVLKGAKLEISEEEEEEEQHDGGEDEAVDEAEAEETKERTVLHQAARIRSPDLFKRILGCRTWKAGVLDNKYRTLLHYLFKEPRPKDRTRVQDTIDIYKAVMEMNSSDKENSLVNAKDERDVNVLAYAIRGGFKEGVELLIQSGADIRELDNNEANCFHHLAEGPGDKDSDIAIADILLKGGIDIAKRNKYGATPLALALSQGKWHMAEYFLPKYEELVTKAQAEGSSHNPITELDIGEQSLLHRIAAYGSGTELDFVRVFAQLTALIGKYTDLKQFVLRPDDDLRTPLQIAAKLHRLQVVEQILAINPEGIYHRDGSLHSPLDHAAGQMQADYGAIDGYDCDSDKPGAVKPEQRLEISYKIFTYILSKAEKKRLTFDFFEPLLRLDSSAQKQYGIDQLIKGFDHPFRDEHGWTLFDYLSANTKEYRDYTEVISSLQQKTPTAINDFAKPTRMNKRPHFGDTNPSAVSEDGLEWLIGLDGTSLFPKEDNEEHLTHENIEKEGSLSLRADHPVPHVDKFFYFEVGVDGLDEPKDIRNRIGFRSLASTDFCRIDIDGHDGRITIGRSDFYWPYRGRTTMKSDPATNPYIKDSPRTSLGCAVNPVARVAFYTLNGKLIQNLWRVDPGQFYPTYSASKVRGKIRVNFGAQPFEFADANDPGWEFDWKKAKADWEPTKQSEDMWE
ncbi:hypothetical protein H072_8361 [Dactylellina haptotyla CBS 200.50]|uniref:Uncharacterized protein n=1 Tax=Dactylellina haptotyla (strain CBS 200.50) TaxID=1284197 RepID=S8A9T2_DACHA|nr:hypothetical protein H072_8361 [Dactylellina haptotyla CBS 200.50]